MLVGPAKVLLMDEISIAMFIVGGTNIPRTIHEVIAHLTCRLARWDDRL
ncbi:Magnesium transporter CorA-like family protein [Corchorus olitorius]|uniref:Magnesium transporter CorA-like family protein n=1 Tax=Corchorus olitorius TaxID=93759 RepID=A0A1R3G1S4_9ROSI|nr:Magnesium transporter CorA-like family protein [Corchorus olitorius]